MFEAAMCAIDGDKLFSEEEYGLTATTKDSKSCLQKIEKTTLYKISAFKQSKQTAKSFEFN